MKMLLHILILLLLLIPLFSLRLLAILPSHRPKSSRRKKDTPIHILVVLGSGGHTAEMLRILRNIDPLKYHRRTYAVSSGDEFSSRKAIEFENAIKARFKSQSSDPGSYKITIVPRARKIHQSLLTTPWTSLKCLVSCIMLLGNESYPDLIISNGPGTGVIMISASIILRFLGLSLNDRQMRTIYIESWARVRKLSLSGKILIWLVDRFIVQWQVLADILDARAEYLGVLV